MNAAPRDLVWSSQFSVLPAAKTPHLTGDKIVLPPSALKELLDAATVTVSRVLRPQASSFDPYNPYTFAAEREATSEILERQQQLPHPLTFRLVNPSNGRSTYAGIREFSADEHEIGLSPFLRRSLGIEGKDSTDGPNGDQRRNDGGQPPGDEGSTQVTVHIKELPKGTYVRLRPMEAGYDVEDWKALLERYLRDNFTTLTNGEMLSVPAGAQNFLFLVDELKPSNEAVSLVDTDLEVAIEPLNEEQARETLNRRLQKAKPGGLVEFDNVVSGQVRLGEYVDYTLNMMDCKSSIELQLASPDAMDELDLFVSPFGPRQRLSPRESEYVFGDVSGNAVKKIRIQNTHAALDNAEALWISVHGYQKPYAKDDVPEPERLIRYELKITRVSSLSDTTAEDMPRQDSTSSNADEERCKNCRQLVPRRTMILHENFCFRNNVLCPDCENVFQKSSTDWKNHWHCVLRCGAYGNSKASDGKHFAQFHTPQSCLDCFHAADNVPDLAHHRTTTCPQKLILCSFCHLQVPQQGPGDPDVHDPEVVFSGLTPHELTDGSRTTECHLCGKIERRRDMPSHLKLHDLQRRSRAKPRICRNANCGRTIDGVGKNGQTRNQPPRNELGLCDTCFGPLYVSMYDPDGKALKRRVERKLLTQLLTGCGQSGCRNERCKTGRKNLEMGKPGEPMTSKEASAMIKPVLEKLSDERISLHFCTDEASQARRTLAEMLSAEGGDEVGNETRHNVGVRGDGYELEWCVAALEGESRDLSRARAWLKDWAPTRAET
jgi:hypothetical protein